MGRCHVVLSLAKDGRCLIDADKPLGIAQLLTLLPAQPLGRYVRPILFAAAHGFMEWPTPPSGVMGSPEVQPEG